MINSWPSEDSGLCSYIRAVLIFFEPSSGFYGTSYMVESTFQVLLYRETLLLRPNLELFMGWWIITKNGNSKNYCFYCVVLLLCRSSGAVVCEVRVASTCESGGGGQHQTHVRESGWI